MKRSFSIIQSLAINENSPTQMQIVVAILAIYNCRAHEVLNAKWQDFYPDKFLILEGCKGSSNVIIRDREILSLIDKLYHFDATFIFASVSYQKLYRYIKSNYSHLFISFKKRKNHKVTHGFRYVNVSKLDNDKKIRDVLHHRSTKSGRFYKPLSGDKSNGKDS